MEIECGLPLVVFGNSSVKHEVGQHYNWFRQGSAEPHAQIQVTLLYNCQGTPGRTSRGKTETVYAKSVLPELLSRKREGSLCVLKYF